MVAEHFVVEAANNGVHLLLQRLVRLPRFPLRAPVRRGLGDELVITLIKKKRRFLSLIRKFRKGSVAKTYVTNGLLIYD
jgi:hypothetical protein